MLESHLGMDRMVSNTNYGSKIPKTDKDSRSIEVKVPPGNRRNGKQYKLWINYSADG